MSGSRTVFSTYDAENLVNKVAVVIKHADAFIIFYYLPDQVEKQRALSGARRTCRRIPTRKRESH